MISPPKLLEDLEEDPFINHALTSVRCELCYKYGMFLAPSTAMLTTAKHINCNKNKNAINKNDGEPENYGSSVNSENSRNPVASGQVKNHKKRKPKTCRGLQKRF